MFRFIEFWWIVLFIFVSISQTIGCEEFVLLLRPCAYFMMTNKHVYFWRTISCVELTVFPHRYACFSGKSTCNDDAVRPSPSFPSYHCSTATAETCSRMPICDPGWCIPGHAASLHIQGRRAGGRRVQHWTAAHSLISSADGVATVSGAATASVDAAEAFGSTRFRRLLFCLLLFFPLRIFL